MAQIANKPSSVMVNLALYSNSPNKLLPYLLITGPKCKRTTANGLPQKDEIAQLEEILNATDAFVTGVTPKILTGTLTYNSERVNYYYVRDTAGLHNAIARLYKRSFPDYSYVCKIRKDADWNEYRDFLYPSEDNFTWIENNGIITQLITQGDSLTKPRDISFVLLFKTEADRNALIDFAHKRDYRIDELNYVKKENNPYRLKISKFENVKADLISQMTIEIKKETKKLNGDYQGWNSAVIK